MVRTMKDGKNFEMMLKSFLTESAWCSNSKKTYELIVKWESIFKKNFNILLYDLNYSSFTY